MTLDSLFADLLSHPGAVEERPFGPETPVFKVAGKMFAFVAPDDVPPRITLKLDPLHGQMLRADHPCVAPGYHMNKEHWNTITLDDRVDEEELRSWIDESYDLVVAGLSRKKREALRGIAT